MKRTIAPSALSAYYAVYRLYFASAAFALAGAGAANATNTVATSQNAVGTTTYQINLANNIINSNNLSFTDTGSTGNFSQGKNNTFSGSGSFGKIEGSSHEEIIPAVVVAGVTITPAVYADTRTGLMVNMAGSASAGISVSGSYSLGQINSAFSLQVGPQISVGALRAGEMANMTSSVITSYTGPGNLFSLPAVNLKGDLNLSSSGSVSGQVYVAGIGDIGHITLPSINMPHLTLFDLNLDLNLPSLSFPPIPSIPGIPDLTFPEIPTANIPLSAGDVLKRYQWTKGPIVYGTFDILKPYDDITSVTTTTAAGGVMQTMSGPIVRAGLDLSGLSTLLTGVDTNFTVASGNMSVHGNLINVTYGPQVGIKVSNEIRTELTADFTPDSQILINRGNGVEVINAGESYTADLNNLPKIGLVDNTPVNLAVTLDSGKFRLLSSGSILLGDSLVLGAMDSVGVAMGTMSYQTNKPLFMDNVNLVSSAFPISSSNTVLQTFTASQIFGANNSSFTMALNPVPMTQLFMASDQTVGTNFQDYNANLFLGKNQSTPTWSVYGLTSDSLITTGSDSTSNPIARNLSLNGSNLTWVLPNIRILSGSTVTDFQGSTIQWTTVHNIFTGHNEKKYGPNLGMATVKNDGVFNINLRQANTGGNSLDFSQTLSFSGSGTTTISSDTAAAISLGPVLDNSDTHTLSFSGIATGASVNLQPVNGYTTNLDNSGTLSFSSLSATIGTPVLANTGTITANSAALTFTGGANNGSAGLTNTGSVQLANSSSLTWNAGSSSCTLIGGQNTAGQWQINSGSQMTVSDFLFVSGMSQWNVDGTGSQLTLTGGITSPGTTETDFNITNGASLNIGSGSNIAGSVTVDATSQAHFNGLTPSAGVPINFTNNGLLEFDSGINGTSTFSNIFAQNPSTQVGDLLPINLTNNGTIRIIDTHGTPYYGIRTTFGFEAKVAQFDTENGSGVAFSGGTWEITNGQLQVITRAVSDLDGNLLGSLTGSTTVLPPAYITYNRANLTMSGANAKFLQTLDNGATEHNLADTLLDNQGTLKIVNLAFTTSSDFTNDGRGTAPVANVTPGVLNISSGGVFTVNGNLTNTQGSISVDSSSNLSANSYTVQGGSLFVAAGGTIAGLTSSGGTATLSAGKNWSVSEVLTYDSLGNETTVPGSITLFGQSITTNNANVTLTGTHASFTELRALTQNNGTLSLTDSASLYLMGSLTNAGTLNVNSGSLLSVAGTYTHASGGALNLATGSQLLASQITTATSFTVNGQAVFSDSLQIASGGTLGGSGSLVGNTTIASGANLTPGTAPDILTFDHTLTLASGSATNLQINSAPPSVTANQIVVYGNLNITSGATLNLEFGGTFPLASAEEFVLFNVANSPTDPSGGSVTGTFSSINVTGLPGFVASPITPYSGTTTPNVYQIGSLNGRPVLISYSMGNGNGIGLILDPSSGHSNWNTNGSGSWGSENNNYGTTWGVNQGSPGVVSYLGNTDAATFGNALTSGNATITLDGANPSLTSLAFNDHSGSYTIAQGSGGTLTFDNGHYPATLNDLNGAHSINVPLILTSNLQATVNNSGDTLSIAGSISGPGSITKLGAGNLSLSGDNSFSGGLSLNGGTVSLDGSGALSTSGTISFGGGTLRYSSNNSTDYSSQFSNAVNQAYRVDTNGNNVALHATLTSSGGTLTKIGGGTLELDSTDNTFSGNIDVQGGILRAGGGTLTPEISTVLGSMVAPGRTITVESGAQLLFQDSIFGDYTSRPTVGLIANGGTISNFGNFSNTLGPLTLNGGTLSAVGGNYSIAWTLTGTVTVGGSAPSLISSLDNNGVSLNNNTIFNVSDATGDALPDLVISAQLYDQRDGSAGGLEKTGLGTLKLSANNTYTGATTVSAGTLEFNGSLNTTGAAINVVGGTLVVGANSHIARNVNVSSGAVNLVGALVGTLTVSGGTVTTSGSPTVTSADFSADTGTVTAGTSLTITDTLKMGTTTATLTGGTSFTAQGANLANTGTASTLSLSGGTLTLTSFTTPPSVILTNPSFEADAGTTNTYLYQSITGWTGGNGIEQGTSAIFAPVPGNTGLPNYNASTNNKWAFIQGARTLSQTITITTAGNYTVSFAEAGRSGSNAGDPYGPLDVQAQFDSTAATSVLVPSTSAWTSVTSNPIYLTAGSHTLNFVFTNPLGGDKSSVLDAVSVNGYTSSNANLPATSVAATASSVLDLSSAIGTHNLASLTLSAGATTTALSLRNGATLTLHGDGNNNAISATGSTGQSASILPDATSPPSLIISSGANVSVDSGVTLTVQSAIRDGQVTKIGGGTLKLTGTNTYTGNTTVNAGTLEISSGGSVKFAPTTNGVSNKITGTGTLSLKGTLNIDLSGTSAVGGNSWTLVDTGSLTVAIDPALTVSGFTQSYNTWVKADGGNRWIYTPATGVLTYSPGSGGGSVVVVVQPYPPAYASWLSNFTGYAGDPSPGHVGADGISNLMKYVLFNGDPRTSNSSILPTAANDHSGNLVFTIHRNHSSASDTIQTFQYSTDSTNWSDLSIPDTGSSANVAVSADTPSPGVDEIKVTIAKGNHTKLFGRLKVVQP